MRRVFAASFRSVRVSVSGGNVNGVRHSSQPKMKGAQDMVILVAAELRRNPVKESRRRVSLGPTSIVCVIGVLAILSLTFVWTCHANQDEFDLKTKWLRPGRTICLTVPKGVCTVSGKVFLRLSGPTIRDIPLDSEHLRKGVAEITIPVHMDRGIYTAALVKETGDTLASGPQDLKVPTSDKPEITKVVPEVSFPSAKGTYDFELCGQHFGVNEGKDAEIRKDIDVKIDGIPIKFEKHLLDKTGEMSVQGCDGKFPCLIRHWRSLRIYGYPLDNRCYRPLNVSVEVDNQPSNEKALLLSPVARSLPVTISFVVPAVLIGLVLTWSRRKAPRYVGGKSVFKSLAFLMIEPQTTTYSLSRLQLILWTLACMVAYVYLTSSQFLVQWRWELPAVPEGLPMLLGISAGTTVLSVYSTETRGSKGAGAEYPAISDFFTTGSVFAPERFQFFLWTILGVVGFVAATLLQDPSSVHELPKVPDNFLPLMGASSFGYLAGKLIRKPGPVIKELVPPPPYTPPATPGAPQPIRVVGENLSRRAQVKINGTLLPSDRINSAAHEPEGSEFVRELVLTPDTVPPLLPGVAPLAVINPDGQSAER